MKRIVFSGPMRNRYPNGIEVEGDSAAECLSGLQGYDGFRPGVDARISVVLPQFQSRDALYAKTQIDEILVVPVVAGAGGRNGMGQVILGVILVIIGAVINYGSGGTGTALGNAFIKAGIAMIIGGVVQMLMAQPEVMSDESERSKYLPSGRNTTKVGTRISLILGRRKVWGHYLAFNVSATQLPPPNVPEELPEGGFGFESYEDFSWQSQGGDGSGGVGGP